MLPVSMRPAPFSVVEEGWPLSEQNAKTAALRIECRDCRHKNALHCQVSLTVAGWFSFFKSYPLPRVKSLLPPWSQQHFYSRSATAFGKAEQWQCNSALQTNKQKFKVRQPQRAARSKRPNTPSDGSKKVYRFSSNKQTNKQTKI